VRLLEHGSAACLLRLRVAYIKKPHGLAIHRAVFTLSDSDAALLAARAAREQWREPPPFYFVRLSFVESRENKNCTAGSNLGAALWSLTLSLTVGALVGALIGALIGALVGALVERVPSAVTALGIFFRFQVTDFDVFCLLSHFVIYPLLAC
jgi:Glycine zipper